MGQYFTIVNEDKKEKLNPHKLDSGVKFWEIMASRTPTLALGFLLYTTSEQEFDNHAGAHGPEYKQLGRWAGDRISIVGDYTDSTLYKDSEDFKDISDEVREEFNIFIQNDDLKISAS